MSEFKVIETQEELDNIIKERLRREREKFGDYDALKARVSELESENGGLKSALESSQQGKSADAQKIAELESQVAGFETANMRTRIAVQYGLPFELAERLQGADEESIKADAERFAGFMKPVTPTAPLKDMEPVVDDKDAGWRELARNLVKGE